MKNTRAVLRKMRNAWAAAGLATALAMTVAASALAQGTVVPPNGTLSNDVVDLSVQTSAGAVEWKRSFNGVGWRFNRHWDGISASYKPMMTQNTGGGAPDRVAGSSGGGGAVCWIWVDEDWQPGDGVAGLTPGVTDPLPPETYLPPNRNYNQTASALDTTISTGFAAGCGSIGGNLVSNSSEVLEGYRRQSTLYVGTNGTYIFKNRFVLKKQAIQKLAPLPAASSATGGSVSLAGLQSVASGWRWADRAGDWAEYDDSGRISRYGDKNNNTVWLQRDADGRLVRIVDGGTASAIGHVIITLHYDAKGYLTQARDWPQAGNALDLPQRTVTYGYDTLGRMSQVTDVRGNTTRYAYDNKARLIKTTDPRGGETTLTYEAEGTSVKSMTAADGGTTDYSSSWDDAKKLFYSKTQGPTTAAGRRTEDYSHDRAGDLVRYEVNGRTEIEVKRDPTAKTETRTNARGFATTYTKNEFEQITQVTYPDGARTSTTYEARLLNPTEETDELGVKTRYEYDIKGNLTRTVQAVGSPEERITEYVSDAAGRPTSITRKGRTEVNGTITPEATWQIAYDGAGQIRETTDPEGNKRSYVYSRLGDLLSYTDPKGKAWRYTYDADGNQLSELDPLNKTISATYDAAGNQLTMTDERGKVYQSSYDPMSRQLKQTDPTGAAYTRVYNAQGALTGVTDGAGKGMQMDYDAVVRLTKATDSKGQSYSLEYTEADGADKGSRKPSQVGYPTFQRQFRYDARERMTLSNDKAGAEQRIESYTWEGAYRQKTVTDANGKTRYYNYTPHDEIKEVKDPLGNSVRLTHDTRGNVIEVTDANGKTSRLAYDRRNLLISSTDPLGQTTRYTYDANGWLDTITQANGQKVAYDFDAVGRVTTQREYDAQAALKKTSNFTYDAGGNLLTWSDGTYSATRDYDDADQLLGETVNFGAFNLRHAYTYEGNGDTKTYSGPDGATIEYGYDEVGQLNSLAIPGVGTLSVTDWQWSSPKKVVLPGGVEQRMEYDAFQSLTRLKVVNPAQATVFEMQNQYGKLAEVLQSSQDGAALTYSHDDAGRLTAVGAGLTTGRSETFTLDANGNRLTHSKTGSSTWTYDNAGQLTERPSAGGSGTTTYQYDASGNLTQKTDTGKAEPARTTRYTWDAFNRLAEVRDGANQLIARYSYDPFDRRIKKELGNSTILQTAGEGGADIRSQTTHYLQSDWGLLAEADATGKVKVAYGWNPQNQNSTAPIYARIADSAQANTWRTVYYHNDQLGTPQRITDASGAVVWSGTYDAYGKASTRTTASAATALTSNLRFPGQYWDAETGLHYNDRRYYDPDTGRYTAKDPIGFEGGINLYGYAGAAPNRFTDPTGEFLPILAWVGRRYLSCMATCTATEMALGAAGELAGVNCTPDLMDALKDCAKGCVMSLIPIPVPCGKKFGAAVGAVVGAAEIAINSFPGETLVHVRGTDGKPGLKPIAQIREGDEVLAWDEMALVDGQLSQARPLNPKGQELQAKTGQSTRPASATRYEKVSDTISSEKSQRLVHITLDTGEKLTATDGHPFRTTEGWRDAILLKRGGKLLLKGSGAGDDDSAGAATIADVQVETKTVRVFNLEVASLHTFFVGEEGVVVHNALPSTVGANRSNGKQWEGQVAGAINQAGKNTAEVGGKGIKTPFGWRFPDVRVSDAKGNVIGLLECKAGKKGRNSSQIAKDNWIEANLGLPTTVVSPR